MFISYEFRDGDLLNPERSLFLYTHGCNLKCPYCFNPHLVLEERSFKLSDGTIKSLLSRAKSLDINHIVITGGEPTLQKNLPDFIKEIKGQGFKVELCSNGTNFKMIYQIVENGGVDLWRIDLKGFNSEKHFYTPNLLENVKNSIRYLSEENIEVRTTIHQDIHSADEILQIAVFLRSLGIKKYGLIQFTDESRTIKQMSPFKTFASFEYLREMFEDFKIYRQEQEI